MPDTHEHARMQSFEDLLESGTELSRVGWQAASLTGGGMKQWRYYTANAEEFMQSLNNDLADEPQYPVELRLFEDPEWNALVELQGPQSHRPGA